MTWGTSEGAYFTPTVMTTRRLARRYPWSIIFQHEDLSPPLKTFLKQKVLLGEIKLHVEI